MESAVLLFFMLYVLYVGVPDDVSVRVDQRCSLTLCYLCDRNGIKAFQLNTYVWKAKAIPQTTLLFVHNTLHDSNTATADTQQDTTLELQKSVQQRERERGMRRKSCTTEQCFYMGALLGPATAAEALAPTGTLRRPPPPPPPFPFAARRLPCI